MGFHTANLVFGSTLFQYLLFAAVLGGGLILGKIVSYLYQLHVKHVAKKTATRLDDVLVKTLDKPLMFLAFVGAAALGRDVLTLTPGAAQALDTGLVLLGIAAVSWVSIRFTNATFRSYIARIAEQTGSPLYEQLVPVVEKIVKATIIIIAFLFALDSFGYDITALLTSLGIGGVAVAFAARETIADVFGGFTILTSRPFVIGDAVEIGDVSGDVEEIGLRFTRIRTWDKQLVTMPNAKVASSNIVNVSAEPARRLQYEVGLSYDDAADRLEEVTTILEEAINSVDGVKNEWTHVWFWEYGDSALVFRLRYFIESDDLWDVRHDVNMAIKAACDDHGIDMPYPTQRVIQADKTG